MNAVKESGRGEDCYSCPSQYTQYGGPQEDTHRPQRAAGSVCLNALTSFDLYSVNYVLVPEICNFSRLSTSSVTCQSYLLVAC